MSAPRLYCPPSGDPAAALQPGRCLALPEAAAHHAGRVLRLSVGDAVVLFDGTGGEFTAHITGIDKRGVQVAVGVHSPREAEPPFRIVLAQALQAGDKMDFTVQKAVELGVAEVAPLAARRSVLKLTGERAEKRQAHWQQVVVSACEQCGRNTVPGVRPVMSLTAYLAQPAAAGTLRLLLSPLGELGLADLPTVMQGAAPACIELLIGPEGGLDPEEIAAAQSVGFRSLRLGPRILRTETAALATLAALHAVLGDFR